MKDVFVLNEMQQVQALASPLRHQILHQLQEAQTAKQVATALDEQPTKLYHHFKLLKEARLITLIEIRQKRGTWEKYYQATAKKYMIAPHLFDYRTSGGQPLKIEKLRAIENLYQKSQEEIQDKLNAIDPEGLQNFQSASIFTTLRIKKNKANLQLLRDNLRTLLRECERTDDNAQTSFELLLAYYPL